MEKEREKSQQVSKEEFLFELLRLEMKWEDVLQNALLNLQNVNAVRRKIVNAEQDEMGITFYSDLHFEVQPKGKMGFKHEEIIGRTDS